MDEAGASAAFDRMGDLHADMGFAMVRSGHEVRSILTTPQREALADLGRQRMGMGGMIEMEMMGMMSGCPMMRNGMDGMGTGGTGPEPWRRSER